MSDWITALEQQSAAKRAAGVPESLITLRERIAYASYNDLSSEQATILEAIVDELEKVVKV